LVTVEEASVRGGLGGAVAELTSANHPVPLERVGFPGFVPTGSVDWLFREFGLSPDGIAAAARRAVKRAGK
jgi:transketolase